MGLFKKVVGVEFVVGICGRGVHWWRTEGGDCQPETSQKFTPSGSPSTPQKRGKWRWPFHGAVLESSDQVQLSSKFSGRIVRWKVGGLVQAGEVVAQLDDSQLRGNWGQLRGQLGRWGPSWKGTRSGWRASSGPIAGVKSCWRSTSAPKRSWTNWRGRLPSWKGK